MIQKETAVSALFDKKKNDDQEKETPKRFAGLVAFIKWVFKIVGVLNFVFRYADKVLNWLGEFF